MKLEKLNDQTRKDDAVTFSLFISTGMFRDDMKEDIGLIVFDHVVDGHEYSGGIANADKSLIRHDLKEIQVWNKQELNASSDSVNIS